MNPFPCGGYVESGRIKGMTTSSSQEHCLAALTRIRRVAGKPGDPYEIVFVNHAGLPIVPLSEWYRLRKGLGPASTRNTYLTCLMPYLSFLEEQACPWNAPPEQLRPVLIAFHRDRLGCQIHPRRDGAGVDIIPTRETPLRPSTLQVLRAALRDFYLVLKDAGLYAFTNPLSSVSSGNRPARSRIAVLLITLELEKRHMSSPGGALPRSSGTPRIRNGSPNSAESWPTCGKGCTPSSMQ